MIYVRTKDDIYELQETRNGEKYLVNSRALIPMRNTWAYEIVRYGDTVPELCDEFLEAGNHKPFLSEVRFEHWDKQTKNILNKEGTEVYGAIWVLDDEGYPILKSVAKMNKKGDLEVL